MLQVIAGAQLLVGVGLIGAWALGAIPTIVAPALGLVFGLVGFFLFLVVANARLSDRFRAEEYRNRLRAVKALEGERPAFLTDEGESDVASLTDGDDTESSPDATAGPGAG
jgi:hypothetical protein